MTSVEYWTRRADKLVQSGTKSSDELLSTMKKLYEDSYTKIEKEVQAFYGRYAENNALSLEEVNRRLNTEELKSFKRATKEYYELANKLYKNGKLDSKRYKIYINQLRELSAKSYISRLEEIKASMRNQLIQMGAKEYSTFTDVFAKNINNEHMTLSYNIDKGKGYSTGFNPYSEKDVDKLLNERWLGENYSDRIWKDKGKLLDTINNDLMTGISLGHNPRKIASEMRRSYQTSLYNCERLARTETIHLLNQVTSDTYKEHGIEQYQFVCGLDERTCPYCGELDGKVFPLNKQMEGVNYPVIHPNCRCTTIPYFEKDEIDAIFEEDYRVARDGDGELYEIPASMSYEEWKEKVNASKES